LSSPVHSADAQPPSRAAQFADVQALAHQDWLDISEGLARLGGNPLLYLRLLRQFLEHEAAPAQFAQALSEGDFVFAERLAHTIKGTAAGLGSRTVARAAARLEQALRAGGAEPEGLAPLLVELEGALKNLLQHLRSTLPPSAVSCEAAVSLDPEQACQLVAEMSAYLVDYDVAAVELLERRPDEFRAMLGGSFESFEERVVAFDFAEALGLLRSVELGEGSAR